LYFPYDAKNPVTFRRETFESIEDVERVLLECYDELVRAGLQIGEGLYSQSHFFCNHSVLIDVRIQQKIKAYIFAKRIGGMFDPLKLPASEIDDFILIDEEYMRCLKTLSENTS